MRPQIVTRESPIEFTTSKCATNTPFYRDSVRVQSRYPELFGNSEISGFFGTNPGAKDSIKNLGTH